MRPWPKADAVIEGTYRLPVITHVCLEPHGLTAKWDGDDKLTVWASTQAVQVVAGELAQTFEHPGDERHRPDRLHGRRIRLQVRRRCLGTDRGRARQEGRPAGQDVPGPSPGAPGGRQSPQRRGQVKLGATKDGKLVAMIAETHGTGGVARRFRISPSLCL